MAEENEKPVKPAFPIPAEKTDQKIEVEEGYRYTVQSDGTVTRLPTYKIWDAKQKEIVKAYTKELAAFKKIKVEKTRAYYKRKGAKAVEVEAKKVLKAAKDENRKAQNAVKDAETKKKLEDRIIKDKAKLEKITK